ENCSFGPFRISYEEFTSEMISDEKFIYANNTARMPTNPEKLRQIIGYGSSPIVQYDGFGTYFLDKIEESVWRLEVYPDARIISDPFAKMSKDKVVSRLIYNQWPMSIHLKDLGSDFTVLPINQANSYSTIANERQIEIQPGVYILFNKPNFSMSDLPSHIGVLKFDEYEVPEQDEYFLDLVHYEKEECISGKPVTISAEVLSSEKVSEVNLYMGKRKSGGGFWKIPMERTKGYNWTTTIPDEKNVPGYYDYLISVKTTKDSLTFPSEAQKLPDAWDYYDNQSWQLRIVNPSTALRLLRPEKDAINLSFTRIGDGIRHGIYDLLSSEKEGNPIIRLFLPLSYDTKLDDYTMSLTIKDRILSRASHIDSAKGLMVYAKAKNEDQNVIITLVESDGT
ncbi:MAG: hypothetical protein KAI29_14990, partial [Cyclobacteriaceae bacterium]|nr:hypothetical protein [Cyclobacteriaceae bacterium]